MKKKIVSFSLLFCLTTLLPMLAQEQTLQQIRVNNAGLKKEQQELNIEIEVILPADLKISSNRHALLTPVLRGEENNKILLPIAIYGRKREIIAERQQNKPEEVYRIIRRKNGQEQAVSYQVSIPFESWMSRAQLYLEEDLCGCGNLNEEHNERLLAGMPLKYIARPTTSYITPQVEEIKTRFKESSSFIDYPVNQVAIHPDYRNNQLELRKIHDTFEDEDIQEVKRISIHGFASPEGSYANNARLAKGRTETLKNYIRDRYNYPEAIFSVSSTPENWVGFRRLLVDSDLPEKQRILDIIDSNDPEDTKEAKLKRLGATYTTIVKEWFPGLRRADYQVEYIVPDYDAETAARLALERPQALSIQEMYEAARLKEKGSREYNELFEISVHTFPTHPVVNNNAAAMELERGNIRKAKEYLEKVKEPSGETLNNLGCIALLEGDFEKATGYFTEAKERGVPEATANLEEVRKKEENYNITGEL